MRPEATGGAGQSEAAIRGPSEHLLRGAGRHLDLEVVAHDEARMKQTRARPDFAIRVNGLVIGRVELKKPGGSLDPERFTGHNKRQWEQLRNLPNLLYTNGTQWWLYCRG